MNAYPAVRSVLILDNASVHLKPDIMHECQLVGVVCLFLPPYSYDLNPIELAFHNAKQWIRANYNDEEALTPLKARLNEGLWNSVSRENACSFFEKCKIVLENDVKDWVMRVV
jgi:transposase